MRSPPPPAAIVHEDDHLLVVDKPSGLLVIPGPDGGPNLSSLLDAWFRDRDRAGGRADADIPHLHPCHRIDRDTSGLVVYAKGKAVQKTMMGLFAERSTTKIYLCVVNGSPGQDAGVVRTPVEGKEALTQYQVLGRAGGFAVLKCKIHTGRTNQIRIHMAGLGHPLVGDDRFGRRRDFAFPAKRTLLHAWYLAFPRPWEGRGKAKGALGEFTAPPPGDFRDALAACGLDQCPLVKAQKPAKLKG